MAKIYQNSVGILIDLDTKIAPDTLKTATSVAIAVKLPDNTSVSWPAVVVNNTAKIRHTIQSGDLAQTGQYKLQAAINFPGGSTAKGETVALTIYAAFN